MLKRYLPRSSALAIALIAGTSAAHAAPPAPPAQNDGRQGCPGFEGGSASPEALDRFYAERAISIMRLARSGNAAALHSLIATDASFLVLRGDFTSSAHAHGAAGAIEMAKDIDAASFEAQATRHGTARLSSVECDWSADVLFRTSEAGKAVTVQFRFLNGRLQSARGHEVQLIEGKLR